MFYSGYLIGSLTSGIFLYLGYYLCSRQFQSGPEAPPVKPGLFSFSGKAQKRKPKAVSDYDQWKREQGQPPIDPS
jgi:hypothetical protein